MIELEDEYDTPSKFKGLIWIIIAVVIGGIFACGISPLAHLVPWSWEKKLANAFNEPSGKACYGNLQSNALLDRLVRRLYPITPDDKQFSIDVVIVQADDVNAFAALGGKITINSGLLDQAESPDELAGVLAHEMGHVKHRDILQGAITRLLTVQGLQTIFSGNSNTHWADVFLNMGFSRTQEAAADQAGLERLQMAHIDNTGFQNFFSRMNESASVPTFLSDHPGNASRVKMAKTFMNQNIIPLISHDEWLVLKNYCSGDKP